MNGPTVMAAAKRHGVWVIPTFFEKALAGVCYDTAVLINPEGAVVGRYRKTHIALDTTVIVTDNRDKAAHTAVCKRYFQRPDPCSTALIAGLSPGYLIEVNAVAILETNS